MKTHNHLLYLTGHRFSIGQSLVFGWCQHDHKRDGAGTQWFDATAPVTIFIYSQLFTHMNDVHTLYMIVYVVDVTCGCLLFLLSMLKIQFIRLLDLNMDVGPWVKRL